LNDPIEKLFWAMIAEACTHKADRVSVEFVKAKPIQIKWIKEQGSPIEMMTLPPNLSEALKEMCIFVQLMDYAEFSRFLGKEQNQPTDIVFKWSGPDSLSIDLRYRAEE
jgi:hypothetical protein